MKLKNVLLKVFSAPARRWARLGMWQQVGLSAVIWSFVAWRAYYDPVILVIWGGLAFLYYWVCRSDLDAARRDLEGAAAVLGDVLALGVVENGWNVDVGEDEGITLSDSDGVALMSVGVYK